MSLSNNYIYYEKHIAYGRLNSLTILQIWNKLLFDKLKINVNSFDCFMIIIKIIKLKIEKKR